MKKYIASFIITSLVLLANLVWLMVDLGWYPVASLIVIVGILIGINNAINNEQMRLKNEVRRSVKEVTAKEGDESFQYWPPETMEQPIEDDLDELDIFDDQLTGQGPNEIQDAGQIDTQMIDDKVREAIGNSEDEHIKELLARIMIFAQDATKQQTLQSIEQAIDIIGKLSWDQINLFTLHFLIYYYELEINTFEDLIAQMNKILPEIRYRSDALLSKQDLDASLALGCVDNLDNNAPYFTDQLLETYPGLFNNGFTRNEFDENLKGVEFHYGFKKVPDILIPCFHDAGKLQVRFINYPKMVGHFNRNTIDGALYYKIKDLMVRTTMQKGPATVLMVDLILSKNSWLPQVATYCMALKLGAVGMIIATANLERIIADKIDLERFLYVPVFTAEHSEMFLSNYV